MDYAGMIANTNQSNAFMSHNFIKITKLCEDCAVVSLSLQHESRNLYGMVHGGALYTMADCAAGSAARSHGMRHVTLDSSFTFFSTSTHELLSATATVRHRSKTICVVAVDVKDGAGKLLAGGTFTMYATGELEDGCAPKENT